MAFNDGFTEELSAMLQLTEKEVAECSRQALQSVVDEEVKAYENNIRAATPVRTGGLQNSLKVSRDSSKSGWYGYNVEFEGNAPNGEPYQKIANVLNYGKPADEHSGAIAGSHFITKAIGRLKGMDDRIEARIAAELAKRT